MISMSLLLLYWLVPPAVVLAGGTLITLIGGDHA